MKIKLVSEKLSDLGVLYLRFKIGKTEICYSSDWNVIELWSGDEEVLESNRKDIFSIISDIKSKYIETFDDIEGEYSYELNVC